MKNATKKIDAFFIEMRKQAENGQQFPSGANKAFWAWANRDRNCEDFLIEVSLWEREIHDFISKLREAGVKSFIFSDTSTALMYNIHGFVAEGCKMMGLATFERKRFYETEIIQGIRFNIQ